MLKPKQNPKNESAKVNKARQVRLSRKEKISALMDFFGLSRADAIAQLKDIGEW